MNTVSWVILVASSIKSDYILSSSCNFFLQWESDVKSADFNSSTSGSCWWCQAATEIKPLIIFGGNSCLIFKPNQINLFTAERARSRESLKWYWFQAEKLNTRGQGRAICTKWCKINVGWQPFKSWPRCLLNSEYFNEQASIHVFFVK